MNEPSEEHPLYTKFSLGEGSSLWGVNCNEGWRSIIVASGMYEYVADWLIDQIQGKPFPKSPGEGRKITKEFL